MYLSSVAPQKLRLQLINVESDVTIGVAVYYRSPHRLDVYHNFQYTYLFTHISVDFFFSNLFDGRMSIIGAIVTFVWIFDDVSYELQNPNGVLYLHCGI